MSEYEITYLARPELNETDKNKLDEAIDAIIAQLDGQITHSGPPTDSPGSRRRLHYPIDKKRVAWLRTIQAELTPDKIERLRKDLRKQDGVLRLTILQTPRRTEVPAAIFNHLTDKKGPAAAKPEPKKPTTAVTMTEVEKKIEQALDEEVK